MLHDRGQNIFTKVSFTFCNKNALPLVGKHTTENLEWFVSDFLFLDSVYTQLIENPSFERFHRESKYPEVLADFQCDKLAALQRTPEPLLLQHSCFRVELLLNLYKQLLDFRPILHKVGCKNTSRVAIIFCQLREQLVSSVQTESCCA